MLVEMSIDLPGAQSQVCLDDLAHQFGASAEEMRSICALAGAAVTDGTHPLDPAVAERIRAIARTALQGAVPEGHGSELGRGGQPSPTQQFSAANAVQTRPALSSVMPDEVRTRRVLAIALIIVSVASLAGVAIDRWMDSRDSGAPAVACFAADSCADRVAKTGPDVL